MWVAFANAKATHMFSAKILAYMPYLMISFNDLLTYNIVSFEQLGPDQPVKPYNAEHTKKALMQFGDNAGPDQPAHLQRLVRAFIASIQNQWVLQYMSTNKKCPDQTAQIWMHMIYEHFSNIVQIMKTDPYLM